MRAEISGWGAEGDMGRGNAPQQLRVPSSPRVGMGAVELRGLSGLGKKGRGFKYNFKC